MYINEHRNMFLILLHQKYVHYEVIEVKYIFSKKFTRVYTAKH